MNANMPKAFNQLSKNEQERILKKMRDTMDEELCQAQFVWIQCFCGYGF